MVRAGGGVVRMALALAYGVHESGYREVIALDVGRSGDGSVLAQLPPRAGRARPSRRPAGHLRRPRRAEEGDRPGASAAPGSAAPCISSVTRSATPAASS